MSRLPIPPWRDPVYALALAAVLPGVGLIAAFTPAALVLRWPGATVFGLSVLVMPLLEEIVFRLGVHDALAARLPARLRVLTMANGGTAALFALAHLWSHPPGWALATAAPALVFGLVWERHRRLFVPVSVHALYNAAYLCLLGSASASA